MISQTTEAIRPLLFTPITIRGVTAKNRVVVSPMCQYRSEDGVTHAALELGAPDPYGQMPEEYAYRLRLREKARDMPINRDGAESDAAYAKIFGGQG